MSNLRQRRPSPESDRDPSEAGDAEEESPIVRYARTGRDFLVSGLLIVGALVWIVSRRRDEPFIRVVPQEWRLLAATAIVVLSIVSLIPEFKKFYLSAVRNWRITFILIALWVITELQGVLIFGRTPGLFCIELLVWALYPACAAYNFAIDAGMALVNAIVDVV